MRELLQRERPLVGYLFELAGLSVDLDALRVEPMQDGDMGSLAIAPLGRSYGSSPQSAISMIRTELWFRQLST